MKNGHRLNHSAAASSCLSGPAVHEGASRTHAGESGVTVPPPRANELAPRDRPQENLPPVPRCHSAPGRPYGTMPRRHGLSSWSPSLQEYHHPIFGRCRRGPPGPSPPGPGQASQPITDVDLRPPRRWGQLPRSPPGLALRLVVTPSAPPRLFRNSATGIRSSVPFPARRPRGWRRRR
jgi:hypothetical protein